LDFGISQWKILLMGDKWRGNGINNSGTVEKALKKRWSFC